MEFENFSDKAIQKTVDEIEKSSKGSERAALDARLSMLKKSHELTLRLLAKQVQSGEIPIDTITKKIGRAIIRPGAKRIGFCLDDLDCVAMPVGSDAIAVSLHYFKKLTELQGLVKKPFLSAKDSDIEGKYNKIKSLSEHKKKQHENIVDHLSLKHELIIELLVNPSPFIRPIDVAVWAGESIVFYSIEKRANPQAHTGSFKERQNLRLAKQVLRPISICVGQIGISDALEYYSRIQQLLFPGRARMKKNN